MRKECKCHSIELRVFESAIVILLNMEEDFARVKNKCRENVEQEKNKCICTLRRFNNHNHIACDNCDCHNQVVKESQQSIDCLRRVNNHSRDGSSAVIVLTEKSKSLF